MENKNKPETWEIEEVLPKDSESSNRKLDMPEIFEITEELEKFLDKAKSIEKKQEKIEEKESNESAEEINLIFSNIENYNKKYQETSQKEEKRQGLWARLTGGKAKETEEIKSRQKEAQEIYKRLEEIEGKHPGVFEKQRKELIEIFRKEAGEIAEKRAEKVDEVIEGLNEETSKEIEKVNKENPGLFEKISARFKKNGLEIVIALSLLAMLAAMPRENALELITSGRIKSFLPIEYANLGLIASTAAVLKIASGDLITRNIRKYFGDKTLKEEQGDSPVLVDSGDKEEILEKNDEVDPSQEGVKEENDEKKEVKIDIVGLREMIKEVKETQKDLPTSIDGSSDEKVPEGTGEEIGVDLESGDEEENSEESLEEKDENEEYEESFNQVAGSTEYQEAFRKYQEESGDEEENSEESLEEKDENEEYEESFNQVAGSTEYQEAFRKYQEESGDEEENSEESSEEKESLITEKELKILNFIKQKIADGEEAEIKFKGDFGWYVTNIKEEKGKRPIFSLKKKQGNDVKVINVGLSKIDLKLDDYRKI